MSESFLHSDKFRQQLIRKSLSDCKHFNGIQNKACKAGVVYQEGSSTLAMPCIPHLAHGRSMWLCELFCTMTQAEAEKEADEDIAASTRTMNARIAAKDDAKAKGIVKRKGGRSFLACPACGTGQLFYTVAASNGHMWGKCSTQGCVSWME